MMIDLDGISLNYAEDGDPDGAPIVFANSLGTDLRLWDKIVPRLPAGLRIIRFDKRGHGASEVPPAPYSMGALVRDAERLMDALNAREALFVGLSIGGMIAQGLAVKRPDLVRAMVLSNTGAKIATPAIWAERIEGVRRDGVGAGAEVILKRWFPQSFRDGPEIGFWREMLSNTPAEGYIGCSAAIAGTDLYASTAQLRLPTLGIAGSEDGSTPPDLVRETVDLIPGARFHLIRGAGHLPCVDAPEEYARVLGEFIIATGHAATRA